MPAANRAQRRSRTRKRGRELRVGFASARRTAPPTSESRSPQRVACWSQGRVSFASHSRMVQRASTLSRYATCRRTSRLRAAQARMKVQPEAEGWSARSVAASEQKRGLERSSPPRGVRRDAADARGCDSEDGSCPKGREECAGEVQGHGKRCRRRRCCRVVHAQVGKPVQDWPDTGDVLSFRHEREHQDREVPGHRETGW